MATRPISITLPIETIAWLDANVGVGRYFPNRSAAIEFCLAEFRNKTRNPNLHRAPAKARSSTPKTH